MLKKIKLSVYNCRVIIAALSFLFFISIFLLPYPLILKNLYFYTNPFIALTLMIATRSFHFLFILSIIIIVLTFIFGRFYCSFICPLGITIDIFNSVFGYRKVSRLPRIKKIVLLSSVLLAIFGLPFAYAGDPILFSYWFYGDFILNTNPLSSFYIRFHFFIFVLIFQIAFLIYARRFYCTHLCPLGGIFSIIARFAIFKKRVDDTCTYCELCIKKCRMGAISENPKIYNSGECSLCGECEKICPVKSISYSFDVKKKIEKFDEKKRESLKKFRFIILLPFTNIKSKTKILRPPGSVPEKEFITECIRCGECIRVCPTGVLKPLYFEKGILNFYSPYFDADESYCEIECNLCSTQCPTGAIKPFRIEDKRKLVIGKAKINKETCLAFKGKPCFLCMVKCPYNAVFIDVRKNPSVPVIVERNCNGCAICRKVCPSEPNSIKIV